MVKKLSDLYLDARRAIMSVEDKDTASLYARNLLCGVTNMRWETILADSQCYASEDVCNKLNENLSRIMAGEPLAYVLGQWDFYGMTLMVNKNVLIPRDDTCAVTDLAIKNALYLQRAPRILDLCTGSGCIGLAIAHKVPDARVTLADISHDAMDVARQNIKIQKLSGRVACVKADAMQQPAPFLGKFDMIVSNPPYITTKEMTELPVSVKNFEPHMALHGGERGLDFYAAIAEKYKQALKPGGYLCFEFGIGQGDDVCDILTVNGYTILERSKDYNQIERAVIAQYGRKEDKYGNEENSL